MKKNKSTVVLKITNKGRAYFIAADEGLLPKTENGYDTTKFNRFWNRFEKEMDHWEYFPRIRSQWKGFIISAALSTVLSLATIIILISLLLK